MTSAGQLAQVPCPREYGGVPMEGNATRLCLKNGTWQTKGNYSSCQWPLHSDEDSLHNFVTRVIYFVGFTASAVALIIALFIFLYFRSLRCLRNTIHCHLIVAFVLKNLIWLKLNSLLPKINENDDVQSLQWICKLVVALFNYLQLTTFFWMLVEGLYLFTMIVWAFNASRIRLRYYVIIGWGCPSMFIVAWATVKATVEDVECWLAVKNSFFDYIFITPILCVLLINLIILGSIVWILITKLKESNSQQIVQYRKAVKATLVLFPLLGLIYLLFITHPSNNFVSRRVFTYTNNVLQSTQGLLVAIFYCFLNTEVRGVVLSRVKGWRESRGVSVRYARASCTHAEAQGLTGDLKPSSNLASDGGPATGASTAGGSAVGGSAAGGSVSRGSAARGPAAGISNSSGSNAGRFLAGISAAGCSVAVSGVRDLETPSVRCSLDRDRKRTCIRVPGLGATSFVKPMRSKRIDREDSV